MSYGAVQTRKRRFLLFVAKKCFTRVLLYSRTQIWLKLSSCRLPRLSICKLQVHFKTFKQFNHFWEDLIPGVRDEWVLTWTAGRSTRPAAPRPAGSTKKFSLLDIKWKHRASWTQILSEKRYWREKASYLLLPMLDLKLYFKEQPLIRFPQRKKILLRLVYLGTLKRHLNNTFLILFFMNGLHLQYIRPFLRILKLFQCGFIEDNRIFCYL